MSLTIIRESAKLRAWRACVLVCFTCLRVFVLMCFCAWRACVLGGVACLACLAYLLAFCPYVPTYLTCLLCSNILRASLTSFILFSLHLKR